MGISKNKIPTDFPPANSADWIADGEKYALIGIEADVEQPIPLQELAPSLWVRTSDQKLDIPDHWRKWLGTIRVEEIEGCNLILLSKMASRAPSVLDGENQQLQRRVRGFYIGLLLSSPFTTAHRPIALTGSRDGWEIDVRGVSSLDIPFPCIFRRYPPILMRQIERAAHLAHCYDELVRTQPSGGAWRIFRILTIYVEARSSPQLLDRLHQYSRCLDGLILSSPGKGRRQFKNRTELFIGPSHHDLMGSIYDVRSDVEHLHEYRYLERFARDERLELITKEAMVEHITRHALAHVIGNPNLWPHFGSTVSLEAFWSLPMTDRLALWDSESIDPNDALADYKPEYISDEELGSKQL